jgi:2-polyprenyl-3-methyl-5-hydroxy-6-metoxy-1,4-benzoquinol methylase
MHPHAMGLIKSITRNSPLLLGLTYKIRGIRGIDTLAELDSRLKDAMGSNPEVTQEVLAKLAKVYLKPPKDLAMPSDPFSQAYKDAQSELYQRVAAKAYSTDNEAAPFDFEKSKDNFFPYNTQSPEFVGGQLLSHGFLIRNLGLKPGASIVEFGAGWGNSTVHLAMMGYEMTAVEVNKPSIALMQYRAGLHGRKIRTAEQDMVEFSRTTKERYDAALFLACFHHCHDHVELLRNLDGVIKDDGVIFFADEPIAPARNPAVPYPWGLRLDGISLYYTRTWGWLELGFQQAYFNQVLEKTGWEMRTIISPIEGVSDLVVAKKRKRRNPA